MKLLERFETYDEAHRALDAEGFAYVGSDPSLWCDGPDEGDAESGPPSEIDPCCERHFGWYFTALYGDEAERAWEDKAESLNR